MAENNSQKSQLQFLICPQCQGTGFLNNKTCVECQGRGMAAWNGEVLLFWGKKISLAEIRLDKVKQAVKIIINAFLLLFGVSGAMMLGWTIVILVESQASILDLYKIRSWQLQIFWLSLLIDCYIFYRFQRDLEKIKYIPKRKYQKEMPIFQSITWKEAKQLPKNKKVDIVGYFTPEAKEAIIKSWQLAKGYKNAEVKPIHLLVASLDSKPSRIIFSRLGLDAAGLRDKIVKVLAALPQSGETAVKLSYQLNEIIFQAHSLAYQLRQRKIEITEILEAITSQDNEVKELLYGLDVTTDKFKNVIMWLRVRKQLVENWQNFRKKALSRPKGTMNKAMTAIATPVLDAFSQDLTILAQRGYLLPCVGRGKEIEEIFNIMQGGTRQSVILVGEFGVGKNSIIEGIAQRMVEEDVPEFLQDKRLVSLNVAKLTGGASPTEAQQRLLLLLNEIRRSGNIILYISDIHNLIGITSGKEGSIDLADVLAKALSSKSILCLATALPGDYHRYLEGKSSLNNVLEKVDIKEVSGNEAIQILESKANAVEYRNQVFFSYDAIAQTVELSGRYLHERYLPEKAIEIMQEVAAKVRQEKGKDSLITANDVSKVISEKTNIPLAEITKEESAKLLGLEEKIHERMINQEEAVKAVAASLRRARAEMRDMKRPIVNLLFLGPTGVGKTELAKTVAEVYFGAEKNMIRLDMSEYQEKGSINRLIGVSADGGYLTEAVRKNPFSLVLLDEIEKAHPDILNIFLQIMDDGRLTDAGGRTIDFTNAILIATSNAASQFIQDNVKQGIEIDKIKEQLINHELKQYFRPEFLNRFDGIIVFKPLSLDNVEKIARLMLNKVARDLEEKRITLEVTPQALKDLAQAGFDPKFGARPLRRVIQEKVQDKLANYLIAGEVKRQDTVVIEAGGKISIKKTRGA